MKERLKLLPIYVGLVSLLNAGVVQGREPDHFIMAANQGTSDKNAVTFEHVHSIALDSGGQALFLGRTPASFGVTIVGEPGTKCQSQPSTLIST